MLTPQQNERLTRVGPGTPGGELMRRYWHPILPEIKLADNPVQKVRILGEDLILYRDREGGLGLVARRCPHRSFDMQFGIPENEGLRCPYHGWMFDGTGKCIQQPLEPLEKGFKDKVTIGAYPVQALGGLIWAYLGPAPAPFLPRWSPLVEPGGIRQIVGSTLNCNWLQVAENRADLGHALYLHARLYQYVLERKGLPPKKSDQWDKHQAALKRGAHAVYRAIPNELGFAKEQGESDSDEAWMVNPMVFPCAVLEGPVSPDTIRRRVSFAVPIDDTTTWHIDCEHLAFPPEAGTPPQTNVPYTELPMKDEAGEFILDYVRAQDLVAWWSQGEIVDRSVEHLGSTDNLVIEFRKLLDDQIAVVENGGEPMGIFRDEVSAERPDLRIPEMFKPSVPNESLVSRLGYGPWMRDYREVLEAGLSRWHPEKALVAELMERTARLETVAR
jgi:5,5'-dehydrodivanillate O-demethylase